MVAAGDVWEGHELLNELERGIVRTFLARPIGDPSDLVWLHLKEGARLDAKVFASEIERLQRLSDVIPQVARVLYGGVRGDAAWAASSFQRGAIRLKDATRGADLGLTALDEVGEIGIYLQKAHDLGAVHGLLSPERVLFTADGGYCFTHFGFARLFEISGEEAVREPRYAAPEMVFEGQINKRTDVYGLGTILYELLCRTELYADPEQRAHAGSAKTWEPSFPVWLPDELRRVMQRALSKEPRARYSSVRMMLVDLEAMAYKCSDFFSRSSGRPGAEKDPDGAAPAGTRPATRGQKRAVVKDDWEPFEPSADERARDLRGSDDEPAESTAPAESPASPEAALLEETPADDARRMVAEEPGPPPGPLPEPPDLEPLPSSPRVRPIAAHATQQGNHRTAVRSLAAALVLGAMLAILWKFPWTERPVSLVARLPRVVRVAAPPRSARPLNGPAEGDVQPPNEARARASQGPGRPHGAAFARRAADTPAPTGARALAEGVYIYNGDTSF